MSRRPGARCQRHGIGPAVCWLLLQGRLHGCWWSQTWEGRRDIYPLSPSRRGVIGAACPLEEGVHSWRHPPLPDSSWQLSLQQSPAAKLPATATRAAAWTLPPPSSTAHPQQKLLEAFSKCYRIPPRRVPELTTTFPTEDSQVNTAPAFHLNKGRLSNVTGKLLSYATRGPSTPRAGT